MARKSGLLLMNLLLYEPASVRMNALLSANARIVADSYKGTSRLTTEVRDVRLRDSRSPLGHIAQQTPEQLTRVVASISLASP